ncbi:MAG TPA: hypothetical protein VIG55_14915, partial [Methylosinus sp.]
STSAKPKWVAVSSFEVIWFLTSEGVAGRYNAPLRSWLWPGAEAGASRLRLPTMRVANGLGSQARLLRNCRLLSRDFSNRALAIGSISANL